MSSQPSRLCGAVKAAESSVSCRPALSEPCVCSEERLAPHPRACSTLPRPAPHGGGSLLGPQGAPHTPPQSAIDSEALLGHELLETCSEHGEPSVCPRVAGEPASSLGQVPRAGLPGPRGNVCLLFMAPDVLTETAADLQQDFVERSVSCLSNTASAPPAAGLALLSWALGGWALCLVTQCLETDHRGRNSSFTCVCLLQGQTQGGCRANERAPKTFTPLTPPW